MECAEVARRLWEYLDCELSAKEASALAAHLDGCRGCNCRRLRHAALLTCLVRALRRSEPAPARLRLLVQRRLEVERRGEPSA
jgi:anti-sigma factor (TIGR02949 family)